MEYCRYVSAMRTATNQTAEYALSSPWSLPSKLAPEYHVDADPSYRSVSAILSTSIYVWAAYEFYTSCTGIDYQESFE